MNLKDILGSKGNKVFSIEPTATLADVVQALNNHRCGALVVCKGDKMVGIISERDILRTLAAVDEPLEEIPVETRMTTEVFTGKPGDDVNKTMSLMSKNRIRHLPILEDEKLVGVISIGDVVKAHLDRLMMENQMLMDYIQS